MANPAPSLEQEKRDAGAGRDALAAGPGHAARLRTVLVAPRPRGRAGPDHHAGAGRDRLCRRIGAARRLRAVRDHRAAAGVRPVRAQPHSRAGSGFLARPDHPRHRPAALGRRSDARRRPRRCHGDRLRADLHSGRCHAAGLHHRAAVQADSLWLHERHRAHRADQPAAQAARFLRGDRRPVAQPVGHRRGGVERKHQLDGVSAGRRHAGDHPAAEGKQAPARRSDRGDRRHPRRRRA